VRKAKATDQILPNDHEFDGSYRYNYHVMGFNGGLRKAYEYKKYCTKCNITWETYRNLGKEGAPESWEAEANQWERRAKEGNRHAKDRYKSYMKIAGQARLITDCDKVRIFGWYSKPQPN